MIDIVNIIEINKFFCEISDEPFGIRDKNLLHSLKDSPYQEFSGISLYPEIQDKISLIVLSIIKNHVFVNGNKRTAVEVYFVLCEDNNIKPKDDSKIINIILSLVKHDFDVHYAKKLLF